MRSLILLICLTMAPNNGFAQAEVDCRVIAALSRIRMAEAEALAPPQPDRLIISINTIAAELRNLDASSVDFALRDDASALDRQTLRNFLNLTARLLTLATTDDLTAVRDLLERSSTQSLLGETSLVFPAFDCPVVSAPARQISTAGDVGESSKATPKPRAMSDFGSVSRIRLTSPMLIAGFSTVIVVTVLWFGMRHFSRHRRRARRYSLYYVVQIRTETAELEGVIHDLSCFGAKLDHYGLANLSVGEEAQLFLDGRWHDVTVQWTRQTHAGLKFKQRMRILQVARVVANSRKAGNQLGAATTPSKTAPGGAPL